MPQGFFAMSATTAPHLPPTFNRLAWSNLAAQSAEQIALAAAPIVAVLMLGVAEGETGLLQTALTLPFILFAIPAGLLTDRMSRRTLMAGAEALRAAALAAILALIWLGWLNLSLLALLFRTIARWGSSDATAVLPSGVFWAANIVTALLFGLGHLPATAAIVPLTAPLVVRAVVLNGAAGLVFGWLYKRFGLEWAMASHFGADLVLHVVIGG